MSFSFLELSLPVWVAQCYQGSFVRLGRWFRKGLENTLYFLCVSGLVRKAGYNIQLRLRELDTKIQWSCGPNCLRLPFEYSSYKGVFLCVTSSRCVLEVPTFYA